ncbi:MAG: cytochrome-c oxidase, cbb3-type subunit III [Alphaproteobacteria bacterium]|nr:cytochrome-c oxidase, cbb3-type subunit III [Alphaproteobacteria bacterium]
MPTKIEKDEITGQMTTGHEWDGLKELNNPLPRWWLYVLYACIGISVLYFILYPAIPWGAGYTKGLLGLQQREILDRQMERAFARQADLRNGIQTTSLEEIAADENLASFAWSGGQAAFAGNCAPCHGLGGSGQAGGYPVLADDDWLWGGTLADIEYTLQVGIRHLPDDTRYSEMPRYGVDELLTPEEIADVAHHVLSLSGSEHDGEAATRGAGIYEEQCAACHGETGEGDMSQGAPRLSDQVWLYGGTHEELVRQIGNPKQGVMPAFADRLDDATIKMLSLYVHRLGGGQ